MKDSTAKFTPGPWVAQWICNNDWSVDGPKLPSYFSPNFTEPDAKLIAAAPELYEAALSVVNSSDYDEDQPLIRNLKAAIAKAEGEVPNG